MNNDNNKYNIITLCGSIKFKDEILKLQEKLTLEVFSEDTNTYRYLNLKYNRGKS